MPEVRIPRTSTRREATFATLIARVLLTSPFGTAFEGKFLRTGARIDESALWPDPGYPAIPLVLEDAGIARPGWGHNRSSQLRILWRWDADAHEWRELARVVSVGIEWVEALRPIALRHLANPSSCAVEEAHDACGRVLRALERELELLETGGRREMLGMLHSQFTARMVELQL